MDDDDIFNDDDFDLIGILERTELEYRNSQQRKHIYSNAINASTNADTVNMTRDDLQQHQQANASHAEQELPTDSTTNNWFSTLQAPEYYGLDYEKQKVELESALRQAARLRSELTFKNQELESTKSELREFKHKLHQQTSKAENVLMDIDPQSPATSASSHFTRDSERNAQSAPRRSTVFPSMITNPMKRPRTSVSPSPGPSMGSPLRSSQRAQTPMQPSLPPVKSEVEIKKQRELEQTIFNRAVNASVANQLGTLKQEIELQRKVQKNQDGEAFLRNLGSVNFIKSRSNPSKSVETIILNELRPTQRTTESDSILNALANDLSRCISQVAIIGVKATISQSVFILRIFIQLCVQEEKIMMFIRATELLYTLATYYQSQIISHLTQEMLGAGDQSTLHFLTKGLALIPLKNADEGYGKGAYIQGFTDTTNMNYRNIKALLHGHSFGPSDTRRLLTGITPSQAQETVSMILKLLSGLGINGNVMEIKSPGSTKRLLFLLDQKGFTDLISPQKPLTTTNEALLLVHALVADGNTDWLYVEKHHKLLKNLYLCLTVPRPHGILELKWYNIRQTAIRLFSKIMAIVPTPLSPETAFNLALRSSIYTLNNECLRIEEGYMPPFESVPKPESNHLLVDTLSLMHMTLDTYPMLLDLDYHEDDVYFQILTALKRFEPMMRKSMELKCQGESIFNRLSDLLKQKNTPMMS